MRIIDDKLTIRNRNHTNHNINHYNHDMYINRLFHWNDCFVFKEIYYTLQFYMLTPFLKIMLLIFFYLQYNLEIFLYESI
jgi:hypothetical protein